MLIIRQKQVNQLITTLKEAQSACNQTSTYLFEFTNAGTHEKFYVVAVDKSNSPCRYQAFCVTDTGSVTPDPYQSQVSLLLQGQYHYRVFANPNGVLDPTCLEEVETGRLLVTGEIVETEGYEGNVDPEYGMYINTDLKA